ncbi:hypothetical protein V6N11_030619 [Hibiscus sabdariffa]|uniref:RNase H type-1 domain-containing protein n=2 Tax=Hibiscus sabdariffa TaxID=183260 RepID=A0ABR1ZNS5_9ROSI
MVVQEEGLCKVVCWNPPPPGWYLVNTDGARHLYSGHATCGGVIRDCFGTWCLGYTSVVNHIDAWVKRDWLIQCRRIHRNGSKVTNALAKLADLSHLNCLCFSVPPSLVAGLLQADVDMLTVS